MYTIGVCGYSGTGSSAVSDLLKEYPENQVIDRCEFILPYEPDGLMDLEYHMTRGSVKFSSSNTAIYRFRKAVRGGQFRYIRELTGGALVSLSEHYLSSIVQCAWIGSSPADKCNHPLRDLASRFVVKYHFGNIYYSLEKILGREVKLFPLGTMWYSSHPDTFYEATRLFVREVLNAIETLSLSSNIVLDQPFPGNNPQACFPYFDNPLAIVVDRDPRDLYLLTREYWFKKTAWRPLPTNNVKQFIDYYKGLRYREAPDDPHRVLRIQFEDLVYRYDETRSLIESFCGLGQNNHQRQFFDPAKSANNTQLFNYYKGYEDDLRAIEAELSDYLYPFASFTSVDFNRREMFD